MKCVVDYTTCAGLGICESLAPDYFEVDDGGDLNLLHDEIAPEALTEVQEAVAACPTGALSIQ